MTRNETIELLASFKKHKPKYWNNFSNEDKQSLVDDWTNAFIDSPMDDVTKLVDQYIKSRNRIPYPRQIKDLMTDVDKPINNSFVNRWYSHFPQSGTIEYNDKDIEWATLDDWRNVPGELKKRMKFKPDNTDPERLKLLKEVRDLQIKTFGSSCLDDEIKKMEAITCG